MQEGRKPGENLLEEDSENLLISSVPRTWTKLVSWSPSFLDSLYFFVILRRNFVSFVLFVVQLSYCGTSNSDWLFTIA